MKGLGWQTACTREAEQQRPASMVGKGNSKLETRADGEDEQRGVATGELHGGVQVDGLDERRHEDQGRASSERETWRGASGVQQLEEDG